jgi:hypothetical protein
LNPSSTIFHFQQLNFEDDAWPASDVTDEVDDFDAIAHEDDEIGVLLALFVLLVLSVLLYEQEGDVNAPLKVEV